MKTKYLMQYSAALFVLLLQSCIPKGDGCEEHEPVNTYYTISEADKSKIPFSGSDTLVYISTDGDTAVLYGQGKKAFNEKVAEKWDPDPGCSTYDYNYFENIEFIYKGNHPDLNYIFIDLSADMLGPNAGIRINKLAQTVNFDALNNEALYKDSINVNNIMYWSIKVLRESEFFYYYNYQLGLIRLYSQNKVWTIVR